METGCVDIDEFHKQMHRSETMFDPLEFFSGLYNREVENLPLLF